MIEAISLIAEHRIKEAMKQGEFENLPGKGKPLDLAADANIPQDLRMAYTLLKNGGYLDDGNESMNPKEIASLESMLKHNPDERLSVRKMRKLTVIELRIEDRLKRQIKIKSDGYVDKVLEKICVEHKE